MALEITGVIIRILPVETGTSNNGKEWQKQTFAIETDGQYPKTVAFLLFNKALDHLKPFKMGDMVRVSFDVESREYNNKFFTDLKPWKIEAAGEAKPQATPNTATQPDLALDESLPL
jgi:hypothetical protein